ncbi:MAG: choice-of-anchor Q domain-containing protein [Kiritimatiellae bacterium]|nr:choice-of-anchor Q domain-containing protein [Kiritimatiellia bacterium]
MNTTISGNYAKRGGGVRVHDSRSIVSLQSTLISGNSDDLDFPDVLGTFVAVTNCLISVTNGVALPGANNILGLPAPLDSLADNGGLTRTHALPRRSPAIDKGSNPLALATDQRGPGFPRQLGTAVDIGAYEYLPPPPATIICVQ